MRMIKVVDYNMDDATRFTIPDWWSNFVLEIEEVRDRPVFESRRDWLNYHLRPYGGHTFEFNDSTVKGRYVQFDYESDFLAFILRYGE